MNTEKNILEILNDGAEHYYLDIASELKMSPQTVAAILSKLRQEGLVTTPLETITRTLTKNKVGYYILTKENQ